MNVGPKDWTWVAVKQVIPQWSYSLPFSGNNASNMKPCEKTTVLVQSHITAGNCLQWRTLWPQCTLPTRADALSLHLKYVHMSTVSTSWGSHLNKTKKTMFWKWPANVIDAQQVTQGISHFPQSGKAFIWLYDGDGQASVRTLLITITQEKKASPDYLCWAKAVKKRVLSLALEHFSIQWQEKAQRGMSTIQVQMSTIHNPKTSHVQAFKYMLVTTVRKSQYSFMFAAVTQVIWGNLRHLIFYYSVAQCVGDLH